MQSESSAPPDGAAQGGAYLGLVSALALAYGGFLSLRQEGIARRDAPREIAVVRPGGQDRS